MAEGLRDLIERHGPRLTPADRRLLDTALVDPRGAAFLTSVALAERAGVNQATAVRLARKLGLKGYPEFRATLQRDLLDASEPALRVSRRLSGSGARRIIDDLIATDVSALEALRTHVAQESIDRAAHTLMAARRIVIFAQGNSTVLADLLDRRMRRAGYDSRLLTGSSRELAEHLPALEKGDVVVAFVLRRLPHGLSALLRAADVAKATTILIGDLIGHAIESSVDVRLLAPRGPEDEFQTLSVPMLIANALVLTLARLDGGRSVASLDRLAERIRAFERDE